MSYYFSSSTLSLLNECPRCFWLHFRKGIKRPKGIFPTLPGGMDRILKTHFDSFRTRNQLPPELKELDGDAKLFGDARLLEEWRDFRKGLRWRDSQGNLLVGVVDDLLQKEGKLIVLDYKTRGLPPKENTAGYYQTQMDIYNFLLRKNGHKTEDYAYLLFYYPDKVNGNGDVIFNKELVKINTSAGNPQKILEKALQVLEGELPAPTEGCEYCKWVSACPTL